ncbi:MAG: hypothetical protein HKP50_19945 [Myxococcales bacterium]|nr:hypothetical protein [Myxococcales bacterium]
MRVAFFLWSLSFAAGCIIEDRPIAPPGDGGVDAGPCGTCPVDQPVCTSALQCVQCTADDDDYCTAQALVCNPESSTCVGCSGDADCTEPNAARCSDGMCTACDDRRQCDDVDGLPGILNACNDEGVCVDCTPESEAETCPDSRACNPRTEECTDVQIGRLEVCEQCVSDSQCGDDGDVSEAHRCVPMFYETQENRFPDGDTGFCLKSIELGGTCVNPFRIPVTRSSLSGADPDEYCGINEELATCPAVRALIEDQDCNPANGDDDCPQPSGLCKELPGMTNSCTYLCGDIVECKSPPAPGSTCDSPGTGGVGGSGGDDYCGG